MANEIITTKQNAVEKPEDKLSSAASKIANIYLQDLINLNAAVGVPMTEESKRCATNAIISLVGSLGAEEVRKLPREQLIQVLQFVTINGLDVFSDQVFLDKHWNVKEKRYDIKAKPQGNAYEIMTRRFGVDVKAIHQAIIVHEGEELILPQYDGLNITNMVYKPKLDCLDNKAAVVYYIIEKTDGRLDYAIATRDGVAKNLMAQILQNTLHDESVNRAELMKELDGKTLDELLADPKLAQYISPTYRSPASKESMIITKMKKNALLHYTRDLGRSAAFEKVASVFEEDSNTDMVVGKNVVSEQDGDGAKAEGNKIADFAVKEPEEPAEAPVEETKPAEVKKEEPKKETTPIEEEPVGIDVFDLEGL